MNRGTEINRLFILIGMCHWTFNKHVKLAMLWERIDIYLRLGYWQGFRSWFNFIWIGFIRHKFQKCNGTCNLFNVFRPNEYWNKATRCAFSIIIRIHVPNRDCIIAKSHNAAYLVYTHTHTSHHKACTHGCAFYSFVLVCYRPISLILRLFHVQGDNELWKNE